MRVTFKPAPGDLAIVALFRSDGLHLNGKVTPWDEAQPVIEYGERAGVSVAMDPALGHSCEILPSAWVNPNPPQPDPVAEAAAALEAWRETASADAWQIAFVLGEEHWQALVTWADGYFNTRILVAKATVIPRASDTVELMAWVLNMKDAEVDEVFRQAATIRA